MSNGLAVTVGFLVGQGETVIDDDLALAHALAIEGRLDAVLGPAGAVWDHAPQVLLTVEAGGRYTDRNGGQRLDAEGGLYTNGLLDGAITATPGLRPPDWLNQ